jgi:hypothetical protein
MTLPCFYCDEVFDEGERDHFPIPVRHGGVETVFACHLCHTLKDRKRAGWLEPTLIYEGTGDLSRHSRDGMPLLVHLLDVDGERWVSGEALGNWPTHDELERVAAWVRRTVERCSTAHARLFVAWFFCHYLDVVDDVLKTARVHTPERKRYAEGGA